MSCRILVIPEDPTYNGYILKPLVKALAEDAGKPRARIQILTDPHISGYNTAHDIIHDELPARYGHYNLWIFMPDADCATPEAMSALEAKLKNNPRMTTARLLCCPAKPEVEIYACAAYQKNITTHWSELREHRTFKEDVFEPLRKQVADLRSAGGGRETMINASLRNLPNLLSLCPELRDLRDRIREILT